jgi:hypothetical protein
MCPERQTNEDDLYNTFIQKGRHNGNGLYQYMGPERQTK